MQINTEDLRRSLEQMPSDGDPAVVRQWIEDSFRPALRKASTELGELTARLKSPDGANPGVPAMGFGIGLDDIYNAVTTTVGGAITGVASIASETFGKIVGLPGGIAGEVINAMLTSGFVKKLLELILTAIPLLSEPLAKAGEELLKAIEDAAKPADGLVKTLGSGVGSAAKISGYITREVSTTNIPKEVAAALQESFDHILEVLLKVDSGKLKDAVLGPLAGPLAQLDAARAWFKVIPDVVNRTEAVMKAIDDFFEPGGSAKQKPAILEVIQAKLKLLVDGGNPAELALGAVKMLVFPFGPMAQVFREVASGNGVKSVFSNIMPFSLGPGDLHAWVNCRGVGQDPLVREYKLRVLDAADRYLRGTLGNDSVPDDSSKTTMAVRRAPGASLLPARDERHSVQLLSDLINLLTSTTVEFVICNETIPQLVQQWDHFEDVGLHAAQLISRQLAYQVRAACGLFLRGIWVFSVGNEALVELVGTAVSSLVGALLNGLMRDLAWTFEIRSGYQADEADLQNTGLLLDAWDSSELVWQPDGTAVEPLRYFVLLRGARSATETTPYKTIMDSAAGLQVKKLLRDLGAFMDMSYHRLPADNRFGPIDASEHVTVLSAQFDTNPAETPPSRLVVHATTSRKRCHPRPVLRIVYGSRVVVMRPLAENPDGTWQGEIALNSQRRSGLQPTVMVLSSSGGTGVAGVYPSLVNVGA